MRNQGANYNIYLIGINDVTPFVDLCPKEVSPAARTKMSLAIFQKLQEENAKDITYKTLENCIEQHSSSSDGYETVKELLRRVHPELKRYKMQHDIPKLSTCEYDIFKLYKTMKTYFQQQEIKGRAYKAQEKSEIYISSLDDERYKAIKTQLITDLNIATLKGDLSVNEPSLIFDALPATVEQLAEEDGETPIIRSMAKRPNRNNHNMSRSNRGAYKSAYEPIQCKGCGAWGHPKQRCNTVPKVALCMDFISKNKPQADALIKEYLKVNNKNTKRSIVRTLMNSGAIEDDLTPQDYLDKEDVPVDMEAVDFDTDDEN